MKHVVFFTIPPRDGFGEHVGVVSSDDGSPITYPSREHAEKVAARLQRDKMITPSAYLHGASFHYGYLGEYVREVEQK